MYGHIVLADSAQHLGSPAVFPAVHCITNYPYDHFGKSSCTELYNFFGVAAFSMRWCCGIGGQETLMKDWPSNVISDEWAEQFTGNYNNVNAIIQRWHCLAVSASFGINYHI